MEKVMQVCHICGELLTGNESVLCSRCDAIEREEWEREMRAAYASELACQAGFGGDDDY